MSNSEPAIGRRKADHIALCATDEVEYRNTRTLLNDVQLHHVSLPELSFDEIDMRTTLCGHELRVPLMISGMTGGIPRAGEINRMLARIAGERGMAFGVGSQRPILRDPAAAASYQIRDVAPDLFLCGNIGAVQAAEMSAGELQDLVGTIDANALCIHLNPAQELIQDDGDRDFRGALDGLRRAVSGLNVPVIAKETGCGMSLSTLRTLRSVGIKTVDISGAGGTTWVGVEALRAGESGRSVGEDLWDWGIPTAASTAFGVREGFEVIASGGIRTGLDVARALALGANVGSSALPFLRAAVNEGEAAAAAVADTFIRTLKTTMLLTGSVDLAALRGAPRHIGPDLTRWMEVR